MSVYLAVAGVAAVLVGLWFVFTGIGLVLLRGFRRASRDDVDDLRVAPWVGWGGALAFLQVWHVGIAVNDTARLLVLAAGVAGWVLHGNAIRRGLQVPRAHLLAALAVAGLAALWVANHTVMQPGIYDSGLYHLNAVRWAREYPLVTGLGNLHSRLAFNNASFLYTALLEAGPFVNRSHHLASGALMLWLLLQGLAGVWRVWRTAGNAQVSTVYDALFVAPLAVWIACSGYASSPSPDVPVFLLALLLGGELLRLGECAPERRPRLATIVLLLALAGIAVKLSFAVFAAAIGLLACWQSSRAETGPRPARIWAVAVALGLVILGPWMARGIALSGFPAYPAAVGRVPVGWALSREAAHDASSRVKAWARMPDVPPETVLRNWNWVRPWCQRVARRNLLDFTLPLAFACLGLALHARRASRGARRLPLPALAAAVSAVAWWLAAPDPRFLGSQLWVLALCLCAAGLPPRRGPVMAAIALLAVASAASTDRRLDLVRTWKQAGPARQVPMKTLTTDAGLQVLVPVEGDQSWNSDLPATPYVSARLRLRVAGDMRSGFTRELNTNLPPATAPSP